MGRDKKKSWTPWVSRGANQVISSARRGNKIQKKPLSLRLESLEERCLLATLSATLPQGGLLGTETAMLTGTGFNVGETVRLQVSQTDSAGPLHAWEIVDGRRGGCRWRRRR